MSRRREKNVGVIGLGIIGSRVAQCLRRRGFHVFVWNRTARPFPNFVGARSEIAELCDVIQIFVSDDDALLETVESLKRSLKPNHVVLAHSTVAPHTMRAAAEIVQRRGAQFLDAPFTGSKGAAETGELVYYLGGDEAALQRARPVLEASSKELVEIGEIGQATTVKVATNMITAATVQAAAEALALVHHAGLSPEKFATAMRGNGSNSGTLTMKLPKMMSGDFETQFSVKHMLKDVHIAARLGRSNGLSFTATEAARDSLRTEMAAGRGDLDYAAVIEVFFPDGSPLAARAAAEAEEQQTLGGLDEEPAAEAGPQAEEAKIADDAPAPQAENTTRADNEVVPVDEEPAKDLPIESAAPEISELADEPIVASDSDAPDAADASDEIEAAPTADETSAVEAPASAEPAASASSESNGDGGNGQAETRRGLFSRMFGRGDDV